MSDEARPDWVALTPLLLFLALFFGAGLYFTVQGVAMGFYQLRAPVAILPALALGAWIAHRKGLRAAIVATMQERDHLTPDLGGTGTTTSFAEAIKSHL